MDKIKNHLNTLKKVQPPTGFIIKYDGAMVQLGSGKQIWHTKAHALTALKNELYYIMAEEAYVKFKNDYSKQEEYKRTLWEEAKGLVEFIEIK